MPENTPDWESGYSDEIVVRAPGKINLVLRVLDRLSNGYHQIWSIMQTVDLFDVLHIRLNPHSQDLRLHCENPALPVDRRNLVYRAAELGLQQAELGKGVNIELSKTIPLAAGLGGGSSDGAAMLFGISRLLHLNWTQREFCEQGAVLGSDIPFFFQAPCALVRGWGQEVTPFRIEGERWAVLVNPGFPIQTKWAYQQLAQTRTFVPPLSDFFLSLEQRQTVPWEELLSAMENDFEPALFPHYPILGFIKNKLLLLGAQAALLSGSGATVFGIFGDQETARAASSSLQQHTDWRIFDVSIGRSSLPHDPAGLNGNGDG